MLNTDLFKHIDEWSSLGDVSATSEWSKLGPDHYQVDIVWTFRGDRVGDANFVVVPILGTDDWRIFWHHLAYADDFQGQGLFTNLVETYAGNMIPYGVVGVVCLPTDAEAERRLASQGFEWRGPEFVLDFAKVNES